MTFLSNRLVRWPLILTSLIIALWCAIWLAAFVLRDKAIEAWRQHEIVRGREWTCHSPSSGGFPLSYRLTCEAVTIKASGARPFETKTGRANVDYSWLHPFTVQLSVEPDLVWKTEAQSVSARWKALEFRLSKAPFSNPHLEILVRQLEANVTNGSRNPESFRADDARLMVRLEQGEGVASRLPGSLSGANIRFAALAQILPGPEPLNVDVNFVVERFDALVQGDPQTRLTRWRSDNGSLSFSALDLRKEPTRIKGEGALSLDVLNRLAGTLDIQTTGLPNLLSLMTARQPQASALSSLLTRKPASEQPQRQMAFNAKLVLRDGSLWLGPLRTPIALQPLF